MNVDTKLPVFMVNPAANSGSLGKNWDELSKLIKEIIGPFETIETSSAEDATKQTQNAILKGSRKIIAVGGDGTVHHVVNGFFEDKKLINSYATLGILPVGTGNDFCRSIGIPSNFVEALKVLKKNETSPIDIGSVNCHSLEGKESQRYFINISSFGFSSEVVKRVNESESIIPSPCKYVVEGIKENFSYSNQVVNIKFDGKHFDSICLRAGVIANGRFFGGNVLVSPDSSLIDGKLDVRICKDSGVFNMVRDIFNVFQGEPVTTSKLGSVKEVFVEAKDPHHTILVESDGEIVGQLPATFKTTSQILVVTGN